MVQLVQNLSIRNKNEMVDFKGGKLYGYDNDTENSSSTC